MSPLLPGIIASGISGHLFTPEGSAYEIAKFVVPSGGLSEVNFNIPSGYRHIEIQSNTYNTASQGNFSFRLNNDTGSNYSYHYVRGNGSASNADWGTSLNYGYINYDNNSGNTFAGRVISILDYQSTTKNKVVRSIGGWDANGSGIVFQQSNGWFSTSPVTSIKFYYNAGNFAENSTFTLIGYK